MAIGGRSETILTLLKKEIPHTCPSLKEALTLCQHAFEQGADSRSNLEGLEVALLDRTRIGRRFRRVPILEATQILA